MLKSIFRLGCGAVVLASSISVASAALLREPQGSIAINTGDGFRAVATAQTLKPGDRVRAGTDGIATIVYDNGCLQSVEANQIAVVLDNPACPASATSSAAGAAGGIAPLAVVAGVGAIGGIIAIAGSSGDDDDRPASP